jgi:hypothetical protein
MNRRTWVYIGTVVGVCVGASAMVGAQKGGGPKGPSELPGTAVISCPVPGTCGIEGDNDGWNAARLLTSTGEMNLTLDGASEITLLFHDQTGDTAGGSDCYGDDSKCLLDWDHQVRMFSSGFQMQSNTLDADGLTELPNGLLSIPEGQVSLARLNMTIDMPETLDLFWRFNFNANTSGNGGGDVIPVERTGPCTWIFSADMEQAALSTIVKPPKGKQYVHHEGRYTMPFVLTFTVPDCGA